MKKIACLDLYALEFVWIQDQCFVYCAAPVSGDAMLSYDINRYHVDVWSKKNGVIRGAGKTLQPIIKKPDDIANYYCMSHDAKWAAFYSHRKDNTKDVAFYDLTTGVLVKMVTISLEVDCINFMAWRPGDRAVVICFQNKDMPTSTLYHVSMAGEINKVCLPYLLHFYQPGSFSRTGNKLVILINDDVSGNYELPEKCRFLTISFVN